SLEKDFRRDVLPLREEVLRIEKILLSERQFYLDRNLDHEWKLGLDIIQLLSKNDLSFSPDFPARKDIAWRIQQEEIALEKLKVKILQSNDDLLSVLRTRIQDKLNIQEKRIMKGVFATVSDCAKRLSFLQTQSDSVDPFVGKQKDVKVMGMTLVLVFDFLHLR